MTEEGHSLKISSDSLGTEYISYHLLLTHSQIVFCVPALCDESRPLTLQSCHSGRQFKPNFMAADKTRAVCVCVCFFFNAAEPGLFCMLSHIFMI